MSSARYTLLIGIATYLLLAAMAAVLFLERTVFADIAFHTVTILKQKSLFIQNQRFVAAFTQVFPLAAQSAQLSLKGVLMSYSVGFIAYYGFVFLACTLWLKQWKMGLVMLLLSTLMVTDTFYWIQSELPQGLALLTLTFALMLRYKTPERMSGWALGLLFVLWFTVAYAHPMLAFPIFFMLVFFWKRNPARAAVHPTLVTASAVFVLLVLLLKNKVLGPAGYDSEAMSRVSNLQKLFPNYFNLASNRDFLRWCLTDYYLLPIGFFTNTAFYVWQKKWFKLLLFSSFFLGYLLLVNVSIPESFHRFYLENLYLPLSLFVAVPLVFDVLPHFGKKGDWPRWGFAVLAVFLAARLLNIGIAHRPWMARLDWQREFLREHAGKLLVPENSVPMKQLFMSWGSSFEFMLLSSLENPNETRLIAIDEDPNRFAWATERPRAAITEWEVWDYEQLPHRYFNPQDSTLYRILNVEQQSPSK
jgi:hypothetical protein